MTPICCKNSEPGFSARLVDTLESNPCGVVVVVQVQVLMPKQSNDPGSASFQSRKIWPIYT